MNQDYDFNKETFNDSPPPTYVTYVPYGLTPETYEERKTLRKTANIIGGSLLIMLAISGLISSFFGVILAVLGMSGIGVYEVISDPAFSQVLQVVLSSIIFTFPFIFMFKIGGFSISSLIDFKKPQKEDILPYFFIGVGFCAFANMAVSLASIFFSEIGINYEVDFGEKPQGFLGFMLTLIATAIVPPLVEEFACRGLILGSLRKFGDGFAILVSSILFGIMHGNFQQIPFAFLVGLSLGFITVKTKSIWLAVAVHMFNNLTSVILDYALLNATNTVKNFVFSIFLSVCLAVGIIAVFLLKNRENVYNLEKAENKSTTKQLYKWFFTSGTIITFIIICFLESLTFFKI